MRGQIPCDLDPHPLLAKRVQMIHMFLQCLDGGLLQLSSFDLRSRQEDTFCMQCLALLQ